MCVQRIVQGKDVPPTHFFVVFDLVLGDDAVGLLGLLPGQLDAALLHLLLADLADLRWSCLDRRDIDERRANPVSTHTHTHTHSHKSTTHTHTHTLLRRHSAGLVSWWIFTGTPLTVYTSWSKFQLRSTQNKLALPQPVGKVQRVNYEWQFTSINSNISWGTSRRRWWSHLESLWEGKGCARNLATPVLCMPIILASLHDSLWVFGSI